MNELTCIESSSLNILDIGRMTYAAAFDLQRQLHAQVVAGDAPPTVLLVEHDPVITISRRKTATQHLLASRELLTTLGIDVHETDRGGDVTYHGPGQLVAYPIIRFAPLNLNVSRYMRLLEQIIIDAIAPFGIEGLRDACATGVWVQMAEDKRRESEKAKERKSEGGTPTAPTPDSRHPTPDAADSTCTITTTDTAKIAALGVRLSRNVSMHGLALNVMPDMSHFNTIVPCGLLNRAVTSMQQLLGDATPSMDQVKASLSRSLQQHLTVPALSAKDSAESVPHTTQE